MRSIQFTQTKWPREEGRESWGHWVHTNNDTVTGISKDKTMMQIHTYPFGCASVSPSEITNWSQHKHNKSYRTITRTLTPHYFLWPILPQLTFWLDRSVSRDRCAMRDLLRHTYTGRLRSCSSHGRTYRQKHKWSQRQVRTQWLMSQIRPNAPQRTQRDVCRHSHR